MRVDGMVRGMVGMVGGVGVWLVTPLEASVRRGVRPL